MKSFDDNDQIPTDEVQDAIQANYSMGNANDAEAATEKAPDTFDMPIDA